jgi:two-component system sensor histidine kinase KdpD
MRRGSRAVERYGYLIAAASVAAATAAFHPGRAHFAKGQWALLYLLIVGLVAGISGVRPALAAAFLSFFAWNYFFLPPYGTFLVYDPRDWLSLFVFLIVGVLIGIQTGRLREREAEAREREREAALLNRFSAQLVSDVSVEEMARRLIAEVDGVTGASCTALFLCGEAAGSRECISSPGADCAQSAEVTDLVAWVDRESKAIGLPTPPSSMRAQGQEWPIAVSRREAGVAMSVGDRHGGPQGPAARTDRKDMFLPLQTATRQSGVLYVGERADGEAYTFREARMVVALAYQASVFLERTHLRSVAVQADALREADRLKSTLLSAVSHELKTPLASLQATFTNLLEQDTPLEEAHVRQELQAVKQDLDRLSDSIDSLLDLSRLEAAAWAPQLDWYELGEIVGAALSRVSEQDRGRVSVSFPPALPMIHVDFAQWVRVLEHLLRNALAYSGPHSSVRVGASSTSREVRQWVEDEGQGIAPDERERVFAKFYRGKSAAMVPSGTGLGLAITREIVRFHGGRIWVEDVIPHGARFVIVLSEAKDLLNGRDSSSPSPGPGSSE